MKIVTYGFTNDQALRRGQYKAALAWGTPNNYVLDSGGSKRRWHGLVRSELKTRTSLPSKKEEVVRPLRIEIEEPQFKPENFTVTNYYHLSKRKASERVKTGLFIKSTTKRILFFWKVQATSR